MRSVQKIWKPCRLKLDEITTVDVGLISPRDMVPRFALISDDFTEAVLGVWIVQTQRDGYWLQHKAAAPWQATDRERSESFQHPMHSAVFFPSSSTLPISCGNGEWGMGNGAAL